MSWYERRLLLEERTDWKARGRIAIQTGNDAWSASISWIQIDNLYEIEIYGLSGSPKLLIKGGYDHIILKTDQGEKFAGNNAERLIKQQFGWSIPVSRLRYWLLALLDPHQSGQQLFDKDGRLAELRQSNWKVNYHGYQRINGIDIPKKIWMENDKLTVKLVFKDWFFESTGQARL